MIMTPGNNLKIRPRIKAGAIIGFIIGVAGFLFLFKVFVLDKHSPEDELAPGMVVIISLISGMIFAYAGNLLQNCLTKR